MGGSRTQMETPAPPVQTLLCQEKKQPAREDNTPSSYAMFPEKHQACVVLTWLLLKQIGKKSK